VISNGWRVCKHYQQHSSLAQLGMLRFAAQCSQVRPEQRRLASVPASDKVNSKVPVNQPKCLLFACCQGQQRTSEQVCIALKRPRAQGKWWSVQSVPRATLLCHEKDERQDLFSCVASCLKTGSRGTTCAMWHVSTMLVAGRRAARCPNER
jgi:hypothetical protein